MNSKLPSKHIPMVEPEALNDRQVSMSNRLARSAQGLNLSEKRLVAIGLASTDSVPLKALTLGVNSGWKMRVSAQEYAEQYGISANVAYEQLKSSSEKLFERYVRYEVKNRRTGALEEKKFRWVSGVHYASGEGYVELNFSPEIAPHLLGLRKQFTTYKLRHTAAFDSIYAWRLYELLQSWKDTGLYSPTIETFWDAVEAPPSCRKDFKALRVRVIEPAVEAIRAKAGLIVEWKPVRHGSRRVSGLEFRFQPDPQARLQYDEDDDSDIDDQ